MRFYPPKVMVSDEYGCGSHDRPFTAEEIRNNIHMLYADVTCQHCGKEQSVAAAGGVDGTCVSCLMPIVCTVLCSCEQRHQKGK